MKRTLYLGKQWTTLFTLPRSLANWLACVLFVLSLTSAHAFVLHWDTNGAGEESGGPEPSGTWDLRQQNWWYGEHSGQPTTSPEQFRNGNSAVFSNGSDATGDYTIHVSNNRGQVSVSDMYCRNGNPTLVGDPLMLAGTRGAGVYSAGLGIPELVPGEDVIRVAKGLVFTINCELFNLQEPADAFYKSGEGTLVLGGINTYDGNTTIEGGSLVLAVSQSIPGTSDLILANGNDRLTTGISNHVTGPIGLNVRNSDTPATFNTGGFDQRLGELVLTGPNMRIPRTIDFANGQGTLSFDDSSGSQWHTKDLSNNRRNPGLLPLIVKNYVLDQSKLRFGTSASGLTAAQLSQIRFADYGDRPGQIDGLGFVTPTSLTFTDIEPVSTDNGHEVELTFTSGMSESFLVERSVDLMDWVELVRGLQSQGNLTKFTDTMVEADARHYYYRVRQDHQHE